MCRDLTGNTPVTPVSQQKCCVITKGDLGDNTTEVVGLFPRGPAVRNYTVRPPEKGQRA